MSYQQIIIVGNLGREPELKYTPTGDALCKFSVAVSEKWRNKANEQQEKTTWFSVSVWGNQAETCNQYLGKGSQVMVIGTVEARAYQGKDGNPAASLDMRARDVRFLSRRDTEDESESGGGGFNFNDLSDIPF